MKVSHYFEFEDHVTGGVRESVVHQRKMLDREGIAYTTEPTLDADVLHCNLMGPRSVWHAKRAGDRGVPVVAHTHVTAEDFGDSFRFTNALAKPLKPYLSRAYGLADALVCPSEYNRGVIEGYTDRPTTVIRTASTARSSRASSRWRRSTASATICPRRPSSSSAT
jgi:hypothetical protein